MQRALITAVAVCALFHAAQARIFFAGSNPQMTVFAFPQDIRLIPQDFAFLYTVYQRSPWWGDIDQPDLRPSTTYLLTGEKYGVKGSADYFFHNASVYNWKNTLGFTKTLTPLLKLRFDLDYALMPFRNRAEGALGAGSGNALRFSYSDALSNHDIYLTSYLATLWREIPLGFKFGMGMWSATAPRLEWNITENGTTYSADRHLWAWSTMQGGRIFGNYDGEEHARYQDNYTIGSLYRFDLQAAATVDRLKFGGRLRYNAGSLEQFAWDNGTSASAADPAAQYDLAGAYTNTVAKKISEKTIRVYGNYHWIQQEKFNFSTLVLSRYTVNDSTGVLPQNTAITNGMDEKSRTFVFQINPNVNIYPWSNKFTFIDLAILCNYSHMNYDFTQEIGVSGGQKRGYVGTSVVFDEDYPWYDFSYARQNFFEVAFDANPTFPVYGSKEQSVALSLSLLLWTRLKWLNKYYGDSRVTGSDLTFDIRNIRKNFEREVWLNTNLNIIYRRSPYTFRLMLGQPLIYSLTPVTRIYDGAGTTIQYELKHENMWVSQSGAQIGLFVSTSLDDLLMRFGPHRTSADAHNAPH